VSLLRGRVQLLRKPIRAFLAELRQGPCLVGFDVFGRKRVAPAAVRSLIDKRLGAAFPEYAAHGRREFCVGLHVIEGAMLHNGGEYLLVDRNVEELGDLSNRAGEIGLHTVEVHELDVRQITDRPPRTNILPEGPKGVAVSFEPLLVVVMNRSWRPLDRRPNSPRRIVKRVEPRLSRVCVVVVHAPDRVAAVAADVKVFGRGRENQASTGRWVLTKRL